MQGFERADRQFMDAEVLAGHLVPAGSIFAFLTAHRAEVFPDADYADLLHRDIDIAVVRLSAPVRHLRTQPWRRDSFVVALPAGHPVTAETTGSVDLARFAEEPWVWLRRDASPDYHDQLMATCHQAGFTPDVRHIANSIATQLAMVACLGVRSTRDLTPSPPPPCATTSLPPTRPQRRHWQPKRQFSLTPINSSGGSSGPRTGLPADVLI